MPQQQLLAHFATFARLHRGERGDLPDLLAFGERASSMIGGSQPDWAVLIDRDDSYILVATECQLIVGVGVVRHETRAAEAYLTWLFVSPDARGRGVGQLLLGNLIERVRSEGAALLHAKIGDASSGLAICLFNAGFIEGADSVWTFGLWNGHVATSYSDILIPEHEAVTSSEAATQALLMAMGTLDTTMLLTKRAGQTLAHELQKDAVELPIAGACALAAARRRYAVRVSSSLAKTLHAYVLPEVAERISPEDPRPTPERILGYISRRHLCLLRIAVGRFAKFPSWYLVTGFDGFLFSMHDVTRDEGRSAPVVLTTFELRDALRSISDDDYLILGKVL